MRGDWRRNGHRCNLWIVDYFSQTGANARGWMPPLSERPPAVRRVTDRNQLPAVDFGEVASQVRPPIPVPDNGDADHGSASPSTPDRSNRAGTPATVSLAGTLCVTTAPAPMTASSPI